MKLLPTSSILLALLAFPMAATAAFTTTFDNLTATTGNNPANQLAGQDGWAIDQAAVDNSFVVTGVGTNKFGALGGFLSNPSTIAVPMPAINLTHSAGGLHTAAGSTFSASFALVNRSTVGGVGGPNAFAATNPDDWFGFTLSDGTGDVFSLSLRPSANANLRSVFVNGTQVTSLNGVIASDYAIPTFDSLTVSFTNVAGALVYTGSTGGGGVALAGSIPGKGTTAFTTLGLDWDVKNNPASQSFLLVDNLSLVPEPSTALMGLLSLGLLSVRRRR